jgi:nucleoside-diphosphate-sugar epimerase
MSLNPDTDIILVTGCTGFVGHWVTKMALDTGCRVRGTVRDPSNDKKNKTVKSLPGAAERLELVKLDLEKSEESEFSAAVAGVALIAHTASPFPSKAPKDENELIKPAIQGTLGVLKAALGSPTVRRIVVTSSVAAVGEDGDAVRGEKDWTDLKTAAAYPKSKTMAEQAAWAFYKEKKPTWSLCTVNPSFIIGPCIGSDVGTSVEVGIRLLNGKMPMAPHLALSVVDVRDVARAHILCLTLPKEKTDGRRFILAKETVWMIDIAKIFREDFVPMGYSSPSREAPYFVMWLLSLFDGSIKMILPRLGERPVFTNDPSREILGIEYIDLKKSTKDWGNSLIYHNLLPKTSKYTPPSPDWTPAQM